MSTAGEERKADEKFEEAIKDYMEAIDFTEGLLVDWVLVVAQHVVPDDDPEMRGATATAMIGPQNQPTYRAEGLLDYGKHLIERKYYFNRPDPLN